jgi:hypothetical protein
MELVLEIALIKARAAARFAAGRGSEFEIQAKATTYPVYTPGTISIIA